MEPSNVLLIFLGAILTFLSTWTVESVKNNRERKEQERNFRLLARQELQIVLKILDTLKTTLEHKNYYEINTRNRLNTSRYALESYRRDVIHLSDTDLQEKFIDVVSRISDYHSKVDSLQNLFWAEQGKLRDNPKTKPTKTKAEQAKGVSVSPFDSEGDLVRFFNDTKLQYSIEHAEIRRQIEELIKELENRY